MNRTSSLYQMKKMKNKWLIVFVFIGSISFGQQTKKVLFLGNSYTYVNNLPQITANLAASTGDNLVFDSNTPGGYTLNGHSTNATSLQKIQAGGWDFVVLQEQSQIPSFPIGQVQTDCFPYAEKLDSIIVANNPCAETMFYMTWGRQNGDASNCAFYPPLCTYQGMDSLLRARYDQMAVDNASVVSPVGPLWHYLRDHHPSIQLYSADESHPSLAGSYAAACSFYTTVFRKDPTFITDDYGLSSTDAATIRNAAKHVVFDSLLTWHIGEYDPLANFSADVQINSTSVTFTNLSTNGIQYYWNFGDGTTSSDENPVHVFTTNGSYNVQLIAENCGYADTLLQQVIIHVQGVKENQLLSLEMSPNPVTDILTVRFEDGDALVVYDEIGKEVHLESKEMSGFYELDFSGLPNGFYLVQIEKDSFIYSGRILKN